MKTIGIFYFSGRGNTELVADIIRDKFEELGCTVDLIRMEDIIKAGLHLDPDQYDYLGIGCPVIGFGVPRLVMEFIGDLPNSDGKKTFLFRTTGGVAPMNYNASRPIIRSMVKKGYEVKYERIFFEATKSTAEAMSMEILCGEQRVLKTGTGLQLLMGMARILSSGVLPFMGKNLIADPSCTHCGLCIKNCPSGNIHEKAGRIRFGHSCSSCMRCIDSCPNQAIRFRILSFLNNNLQRY
jgi:ferredoxin